MREVAEDLNLKAFVMHIFLSEAAELPSMRALRRTCCGARHLKFVAEGFTKFEDTPVLCLVVSTGSLYSPSFGAEPSLVAPGTTVPIIPYGGFLKWGYRKLDGLCRKIL